jgi:hypothetical protein
MFEMAYVLLKNQKQLSGFATTLLLHQATKIIKDMRIRRDTKRHPEGGVYK